MTRTVPIRSDELVLDCLQHLQHELTAVGGLNTSLKAIQSAIKTHDTHRLPELVEQQQFRSAEIEQLRVKRREIRARIAKTTNVVESEATIAEWATQLAEPDRSAILDRRDRLVDAAGEAGQLAHANMAVVSHGLQILHEVRNCLTGETGRPDRYLASGDPESAGPQTLYNTRC